MYFTQVHEDAITRFCLSEDRKEREELYRDLIQPALSQMVDKIVFAYRFTTLPNIDDLRNECKVHLTTLLPKFDKSKNKKAFSYFSVITKNWFIQKVKKNKKRLQREIPFEAAELDINTGLIDPTETYTEKRIRSEKMVMLKEEMLSWKSLFDKEAEKKVYDAVMILFDSVEEIDIFNKKAVYLYLREITGMNTKQIVVQLNKMREKYKIFKNDWDNGKI